MEYEDLPKNVKRYMIPDYTMNHNQTYENLI